jgi:hypothetical protein
VHLPYNGNAPSLLAVATGETDMSIAGVLSCMVLIKGQLVKRRKVMQVAGLKAE